MQLGQWSRSTPGELYYYQLLTAKEGFIGRLGRTRTIGRRSEINADQCPRLTKAFIVEEKALYPSWFFRQEYYNEFAEGVTSVFRTEDIDAAFDHPELPTRWEIDLELD